MKNFNELPSHFSKDKHEGGTDSSSIQKFTTEQFSKQIENLEMESQQEIAAIGYFLIRQRTEDLGLKIKDFDTTSVVTLDEYHEHFWSDFRTGGYLNDAKAVYDPKINKIASRFGDGMSLSKGIHEMLHYVADAQNSSTSVEKKRVYRTGFDLIYVSNELQPNSTNRDYFTLFNEGITEKITHELCDDMTVEKLGGLYKNIFPQKAKLNLDEAKKNHEEWLKKVIPLEKEMQEKELDDFSEFITGVSNQNEIDRLTKNHQKRMSFYQRLREDREKELQEMDVLPFSTDKVLLEDKNEVGYPEMVELTSLIIKGIALRRCKEKVTSFDEANVQAWKNMQKAYFIGDTSYLNILESVYGKGFVKKLANLDYKQIVVDEENETVSWKEFDELKAIIESVNKNLDPESSSG